jgi:hypothetical protein
MEVRVRKGSVQIQPGKGLKFLLEQFCVFVVDSAPGSNREHPWKHAECNTNQDFSAIGLKSLWKIKSIAGGSGPQIALLLSDGRAIP